jgi:hypothetical protein
MVAAALVIAGIAGCSSGASQERKAAAEECPPLPIVSLPPSGGTVTLTVGQLGQFTESLANTPYNLESSNEDVVDTFRGYSDECGNDISGGGIQAQSVGTADITVIDPDHADEPVQQIRVMVTEGKN